MHPAGGDSKHRIVGQVSSRLFWEYGAGLWDRAVELEVSKMHHPLLLLLLGSSAAPPLFSPFPYLSWYFLLLLICRGHAEVHRSW